MTAGEASDVLPLATPAARGLPGPGLVAQAIMPVEFLSDKQERLTSLVHMRVSHVARSSARTAAQAARTLKPHQLSYTSGARMTTTHLYATAPLAPSPLEGVDTGDGATYSLGGPPPVGDGSY